MICIAACGEAVSEDRQAATSQTNAQSSGVEEIGWEDLLPEGEEERLAELYQAQIASLYSSNIGEGGPGDVAVQLGTFNTVGELDGLTVRLPGYTVPFEFGGDAEISEFLLVPYFGACLHQPPPPPNQTVFVVTDTPVKLKDLAQAVWVEGVLSAESQSSHLADAAYTIRLTHLEDYN